MSSERNPPSNQFHRIAYRGFSWAVTGLTVVLFVLLVVSALLSGPAGPAEASMWWSAYQIARSLAVSLALSLIMPVIPVVVIFWAMSDGSPSDDGSLASSLSVRVLLLVVFAVLGRLQGSGSIPDVLNAVQVNRAIVILVGLCVAVVGITHAVYRFLGGRDIARNLIGFRTREGRD